MKINLICLSLFFLTSITACVKPPTKKQSKEENIFKKEDHADGSISINTSKRVYK